jgi:hypothetical protein
MTGLSARDVIMNSPSLMSTIAKLASGVLVTNVEKTSTFQSPHTSVENAKAFSHLKTPYTGTFIPTP